MGNGNRDGGGVGGVGYLSRMNAAIFNISQRRPNFLAMEIVKWCRPKILIERGKPVGRSKKIVI
jgi:hypothetical protein